MPRLATEEGSASGLTHAHYFDYQDLQADGYLDTDGQHVIANVPSGSLVEIVAVKCITAAAGASDIVLNIGWDGADPDDFIDNLDLDGMNVDGIASNTGEAWGSAGDLNTKNGASSIVEDIVMDVAGTIGDLTAGRWVILMRAIDTSSFV